MIVPPFGEYPSLTLSPWMYGEQFTFFRSELWTNTEVNLQTVNFTPMRHTISQKSQIKSQV